jgi:hypothetical protein
MKNFKKFILSIFLFILILFSACENPRQENLNETERVGTDQAGDIVEPSENLDSILHEGVETQESDRSVRGEGTSLDGPDINKTGLRTGTEIENEANEVE